MGVLAMYIKYSRFTAGQLITVILLNTLLFGAVYSAYSTAYEMESNPLKIVNIR